MIDEANAIVFEERYGRGWIRGPRITRLEESVIGYFRFDAETAWDLGTSNIGVFVGASRPFDRTIEDLQKLESSPSKGLWVVVAGTKQIAAAIVDLWFNGGVAKPISEENLDLPRLRNNVVLATPEVLGKNKYLAKESITGIIVLDLPCSIHRQRGMRNGNFFVQNDRPQYIANFRNDAARGPWLPPLFLITLQPAKSVSTDHVARAYCLDGWWFVNGQSLFCGNPPALPEASRKSLEEAHGSQSLASDSEPSR